VKIAVLDAIASSRPRLPKQPRAGIIQIHMPSKKAKAKPLMLRKTFVLGAGASRGVSYSDEMPILSPVDSDFFDLLQRVEAGSNDAPAIASVIKQVQELPYGHWRSMERSFYTLHQQKFLRDKLEGVSDRSDWEFIKDFARCVQVVLRKAHDTKTCAHHNTLFQRLSGSDSIVSFNYDLVAERALRVSAESRHLPFSETLYGFGDGLPSVELPMIFKLHGSSNWRIETVEASGRSLAAYEISVRTKQWTDFDDAPNYVGHRGKGSTFPIFLPFWDKRIEEDPWLTIWRTAFERLRSTAVLVVWGYSLAPTDIKARHLFELALSKKEIYLCVIDVAADTRQRWRDLLPQAKFYPYDSIERFFAAPPAWWS
jgi:hypothetical protein